MANDYPPILKSFTGKRIFLPILIGLGVAGIFMYSGFDKAAFLKIQWGWNATFWIFMAFVMGAITW